MMREADKRYFGEADECSAAYADDVTIVERGDYLCIQWCDHPLYVYKRIRPGERIHHCIDRVEHNGRSYRLEFIQDEKEHATAA
jgi:hypothetical protein